MSNPLHNVQARENIVGLGLVLISLGNTVYESNTGSFAMHGSLAHALLGMWILFGYLAALLALISVMADQDGFGYATLGFYFVTLAALDVMDRAAGHWLRAGNATICLGVAVVALGSFLLAEREVTR